jgi:deazaflavin-dependent oxidoreductase (nitroreductase family)
LYLADRDAFVVVATNDGARHNPAWYLNLVANPEARVRVASDQLAVAVDNATPDERARLWPALCAIYPNYQRDQDRTGREIPVVLLRPTRTDG